ncbi:MAG: glycosyltransferase [Patescibacteria group bacterium]|nr:glycosyltransferase [Patescibacteria group bacterium]
MKIAIVHDYLFQYGGAEKVLEAMHEVWPDAPIYTSVYIKKEMEKAGFNDQGMDIRSTWMQALPFKKDLFKAYFMFYPLAFRSLNLSQYDVVISSSSYAAHHARASQSGLHICYCHTPSRYLYGYDTELDHQKIKKIFPFMPLLYHIVRKWDRNSAKKINFYLTNSNEVRERVKKHYTCDSEVIYPPVEIKKFLKVDPQKGEYFFTYGRLVAHKRVDLIVEAFNQLGLPLKIAGSGLELDNLKKKAKSNIEFLGRIDDSELVKYLSRCYGVIFAANEDFGIVPVETMAAGKPVIAYRAGGVLESILPGKTGEFFYPQTTEALVEAIRKFKPQDYDPAVCRKQAENFDKERFKEKIQKFVEEKFS